MYFHGTVNRPKPLEANKAAVETNQLWKYEEKLSLNKKIPLPDPCPEGWLGGGIIYLRLAWERDGTRG